jgi:hypothetical protein
MIWAATSTFAASVERLPEPARVALDAWLAAAETARAPRDLLKLKPPAVALANELFSVPLAGFRLFFTLAERAETDYLICLDVVAEVAVTEAVSAEEDAEVSVARILERLAGKTVPGQLFGATGTVTIPDFDSVRQNVWELENMADVLAEGDQVTWVAEVKAKLESEQFDLALDQAEELALAFGADVVWLAVTAGTTEAQKHKAADRGILLSGRAELAELSKLAD